MGFTQQWLDEQARVKIKVRVRVRVRARGGLLSSGMPNRWPLGMPELDSEGAHSLAIREGML